MHQGQTRGRGETERGEDDEIDLIGWLVFCPPLLPAHLGAHPRNLLALRPAGGMMLGYRRDEPPKAGVQIVLFRLMPLAKRSSHHVAAKLSRMVRYHRCNAGRHGAGRADRWLQEGHAAD